MRGQYIGYNVLGKAQWGRWVALWQSSIFGSLAISIWGHCNFYWGHCNYTSGHTNHGCNSWPSPSYTYGGKACGIDLGFGLRYQSNSKIGMDRGSACVRGNYVSSIVAVVTEMALLCVWDTQPLTTMVRGYSGACCVCGTPSYGGAAITGSVVVRATIGGA